MLVAAQKGRAFLIMIAVGIVAIGCVNVPTRADIIQIAHDFTGHYKDRYFSLDDGLVWLSTCSGYRPHFFYDVIAGPDGKPSAFKSQDTKKIFRLKVTTSRSTIYDIPIEIMKIQGLPRVPSNVTVELTRSLDDRFALAFPSWVTCDPLGYYPGTLYVILKPGKRDDFKRWISEHSDLLIDAEVRNPTAEDVRGLNSSTEIFFSIRVIDGSERKVVNLLKQSNLIVDASFDPMPLGPDALIIDFRKSVFSEHETQDKMVKRLNQLIRDSFPAASDKEYQVGVDRGTRFTVSLMGPAKHFAPASEFRDRWLIANVTFRFTKNAVGSQFADRLFFEIPDAFLPKWPADAKEAPQRYSLPTIPSKP